MSQFKSTGNVHKNQQVSFASLWAGPPNHRLAPHSRTRRLVPNVKGQAKIPVFHCCRLNASSILAITQTPIDQAKEMGKTLHDRYRDSMTIHGFGYALYEPVPFERLRPRTLGYFDGDRRWHPVLHLTNAAAVSALGCTPFIPPHLRAPNTRRWDPCP